MHASLLCNAHCVIYIYSEIKRLKIIENQGWKNITDCTLTLAVQEIPATVATPPKRGQLTESEVLQLLFSDTFIHQYILTAMAHNILSKRSGISDKQKKYYKVPTIEEFWLFFSIYLLETLFNKGQIDSDRGKWENYLNVLGQKRYKVLYSAFDFSEEQLNEFIDGIRKQIPKVFELGNTNLVDESIYEYFGQDMRNDAIDVNIDRKPHPYGTMNYVLAQRLLWTKLPIAIDFEPRFPHNKPSARIALLRLVERVTALVPYVCHTLADSAFIAANSIEEFKGLSSELTVAISSSSACGYQTLYEIAKADLKEGQSRIYQSHNKIAQIAFKEDHITGLVSTAWRSDQLVDEPSTPVLKYKTAVHLFEHETAASIKKAFNLPDTVPQGDIVAVIKAATGWNISLPPPDNKGDQQLKEEKLQEMNVAQLRVLHQRTHQCDGTSKKKKEDLIKDIIKYHPDAQQFRSVSARTNIKTTTASTYTAFLRGPAIEGHDMIDFYSQRYGLVDKIDKYYYATFECAYHRTWQKLYFFSLMMVLVIDSWAAFEELKQDQQFHKANRNKSKVNKDKSRLTHFIMACCEQIVEKYK